ncbi:MAG: hypothetical protein OXM02_08325 [Bacteroidota bacterium]|nr:hypothetical protein [Bacteroidota bacterium]MDE2834514.1 hypothetical protein [Bacteroidota bacterium]MDE2957216.1 hypothetical protein [Bacteroidota bacterium]
MKARTDNFLQLADVGQRDGRARALARCLVASIALRSDKTGGLCNLFNRSPLRNMDASFRRDSFGAAPR